MLLIHVREHVNAFDLVMNADVHFRSQFDIGEKCSEQPQSATAKFLARHVTTTCRFSGPFK